MTKRKKDEHVNKVYMPKAQFKQFLENILHDEMRYQEKTLAGEELTKDERRERYNLQHMKNHWLDKCVFPSMANLTIFLEYIAKNGELEKLFHDDLEELFLGSFVEEEEENKSKKKKKNYRPMIFERFIRSILTRNWKKEEEFDDFRLVLIERLEYILFQCLTTIILYSPLNSEIVNKKIEEDLTNVFAWTNALAKNVDLNIEDVDRPVNF